MMRWGFALCLVLVWVALTGSASPGSLLLGAGLSLAAVFLVRHSPAEAPIRPTWGLPALLALFLKELVLSALSVAATVLRPRMRIEPAIIAYPLKLTRDFEITLLANLITLTPGTLAIDVSADRSTLLIHALDASDPKTLIASIETGFEARIMKAFRR
jgi:multicomponent Na+:H+ antiporter subunit E